MNVDSVGSTDIYIMMRTARYMYNHHKETHISNTGESITNWYIPMFVDSKEHFCYFKLKEKDLDFLGYEREEVISIMTDYPEFNRFDKIGSHIFNIEMSTKDDRITELLMIVFREFGKYVQAKKLFSF